MKIHVSALVVIALAGAAQASTSYTRVGFDTAFVNSVVEDFDSRNPGDTFTPGTFYNGIDYNPSAGAGIGQVNNQFLPTTSPNSLGATTNGYYLNTDTITFNFSSGETAFGIDINTFSTFDGAYVGVTNTGEVFGSFFDPFPGFSTGQFLGFSTNAPFTSVTISAVADAYTMDTIRLVPGPGAAGLFTTGMVLIARRRR